METKEPRKRSEQRGRISRRQLLRRVPALAAGVVLSSAIATVRADGDPPPTLELSPAETQLPDARDGALRSQKQMMDSCVARGNSLPSDIPPRFPVEAIESCLSRRQSEGRNSVTPPTPLQQVLGDTGMWESRLGLNNWVILEEAEELNLGHFRFAISPYTAFVDDGRQRFLLMGNGAYVGSFRGNDYLEDVQRRMFDRAVWCMANGRQGTAVVEIDRPLSAEKVSRIVRGLYDWGVRTVIWGNEVNDPGAVWRDNLPELVKIFTAAADTKKEHGLDDFEISLPGMAYYGQGEYLQKLLGTFRALVPSWGRGRPSEYLPFQRVVDHYYGPVNGFLQRLTLMRQTMAKEGLNDLKFDLAEVGNPGGSDGQPIATDQQMAEGYIPQVTSLAVASGMVDRLFFYSALDSNDRYSLVRIENGRLVKKVSYQAFVTMAGLLARLSRVSWSETAETMGVEGSRSDGIEFTVLWSKVADRDVGVPLPSGKRVFDALGQEVREADPRQVTLRPASHPALAGPARILVSRRREGS